MVFFSNKNGKPIHQAERDIKLRATPSQPSHRAKRHIKFDVTSSQRTRSTKHIELNITSPSRTPRQADLDMSRNASVMLLRRCRNGAVILPLCCRIVAMLPQCCCHAAAMLPQCRGHEMPPCSRNAAAMSCVNAAMRKQTRRLSAESSRLSTEHER